MKAQTLSAFFQRVTKRLDGNLFKFAASWFKIGLKACGRLTSPIIGK